MELAKIEVNDFGGAPVAEHNMPCAVCRVRHAVIELNAGRFSPCWPCQYNGWKTLNFYKLPLWKRFFLGKEFETDSALKAPKDTAKDG